MSRLSDKESGDSSMEPIQAIILSPNSTDNSQEIVTMDTEPLNSAPSSQTQEPEDMDCDWEGSDDSSDRSSETDQSSSSEDMSFMEEETASGNGERVQTSTSRKKQKKKRKHPKTNYHLSIHLLDSEKLNLKHISDKDLPKKLIAEINKEQKRCRYKYIDPNKLTKSTKRDPTEIKDLKHGFTLYLFVQTIKAKYRLLDNFGIKLDKPLRDKFHNVLIVYCRRIPSPTDNEVEVFALTRRLAWHAIQKYSCDQFPKKVALRLTTDQGNTNQTTRHLTGNVHCSQESNRNPVGQNDKLGSVNIQETKCLRPDCSLYGLEEFTTTESKEKKLRGIDADARSQVQMQIGQCYIRILRELQGEYIPEILDHLSKIYRGLDTYVYPIKDGNRVKEEPLEDYPSMDPVTPTQSKALEQALGQMLFDFMNGKHVEEVTRFHIAPKKCLDWVNAEKFRVTYKNDEITEYSAPPSAKQVFSDVQRKIGRKLVEIQRKSNTSLVKLSTFLNRLGNVKISYLPNQGNQEVSHGIKTYVNGEISLEGDNFMKDNGIWYGYEDAYYCKVHNKFIKLLKDGALLDKPEVAGLFPFSWRRGDGHEEIQSVDEYVEQYRNANLGGFFYFLPPTVNKKKEGTFKKETFFDLLAVRDEGEGIFVYLIYIFGGFDPVIRSASGRIIASVDRIYGAGPTSTKMFELLKTECMNHPHFNKFFGKFQSFVDFKRKNCEVTAVVAFATGGGNVAGDEDAATLENEKTLLQYCSKDVLMKEVLPYVEINVKAEMWVERDLPGPSNAVVNDDKLAEDMLTKLIAQGCCMGAERENAATGKLLKLSQDANCNLYADASVNSELFRILKRKYCTRFPGIMHKLECFSISEEVKGIKVVFMDIP